MAYVDFDFYITEYGGNLIGADDFNRFAIKASDKLDYLSNYRVPRYLDSIVVEDERDRVLQKLIKKATCNLAEMIFDIETAETTSRQESGYVQTDNGLKGKTIQSISAGGESITYASKSNNSTISSLIFDKKAQNRLMFDTIREYLGGSGLLSQIL